MRHYRYILALVIINTFGIMFLAGAFLWLPFYLFPLLAALTVGTLAPFTAMLLAGALWELHLAMNSRLSLLLERTQEAAWAGGRAEGQQAERDRSVP